MSGVTVVVTDREMHVVKPGDSVLVKVANGTSPEEARRIGDQVQTAVGSDSVTIFIGDDSFDLRVLNEQQMAAAGWVRAR